MIRTAPSLSISLPRRRDLLVSLLGGAALTWLAPGKSARANDPAQQRYICLEPDCSPYVYDPARGDPSQGIPAGTAFEDLPDDWVCPDCQGPKSSFVPFG